MNIIPRPLSVCTAAGQFVLTGDTPISYSDAVIHPVAVHLQRQVECQLGLSLRLQQDDTPAGPCLRLQLALVLAELQHLPSSVEGYVLTAGEGGVTLAALTLTGLLFGVQSLVQLLPVTFPSSPPAEVRLPGLVIVDAPRFPWRGLMLDTGRHFFGVPFLLRVLDIMLLYKLNRLHWHLCEDQGWRLEVKQFPRLTEVGAWRQAGGERYGGFYTQDEVRQVVEYAAARGITVVPEVEMPGHCVAALASYPHLSCTGEVSEVSTHWGVHEDVYCAGREEVFTFLEGVLQEVFTLFPSTYIHVGGDEVPKTRWNQCPRCQQRIRDEGLADEEQLQSWFLDRVNTFLKQHNRRLIGWDEILEGGLCEGATVMSWRGMAGGIAAARAGHDVIMTPTHGCYFDYRQAASGSEPGAWYAVLTLQQAYEFEPVPPEPDSSSTLSSATSTPSQLPRPMSTEPRFLDGEDGGEEEGGGVGGQGPAGGGRPAVEAGGQEGVGTRDDPHGQQAQQPTATSSDDWERVDMESEEGLLPSVPPPPRPAEEGVAAEGSGGDAEAAAAPGNGAEQGAEPPAGQGAVRPGFSLTPEEAKHILGGQANLWTEYVATEDVAEYMLMPRLCATAEALWSPKEAKNWTDYQGRLRAQVALWQRLGIRYRPLDD
ncbi:hypothetical protein N2152v2_006239 [Parachlorella kessleri]